MDHSLMKGELERRRTGVRGRKIYLMVAFLFVPLFLCLVNMVIMIVLYTILDINYRGMASMSFFKDPQYVKWVLDADLENIILHDSTIRGFSDQNLDFYGDQQDVTMTVEQLLKSKLSVTPKGTFIQSEEIKFVNPDTKKTILDLTSGTHVPIIGEFNGQSMHANIIKTPRVVSPDADYLNISSQGKITLTGNEGLYADSKSIHIRAKNNLLMTVRDDDKYMVSLDGRGGGVKVERSKLPTTSGVSTTVVSDVEKYRLCICTGTGILFRARVTNDRITCAIATERPC